MSAVRRLGIACLAGLILGAVFSWPLPRHFTSGIASSAANVEKNNVRRMIPGDHLQFLYHLWLAQDTFAGPTPWFHNIYEFNGGDDAEGRGARPYYLPFSLFFTVGSLLGGRACGWNLAILVTLWIAAGFHWKLARRYCADEWVAGMLALVALAFPFQWITWLSGSPTGFAMMWVPILLYGIDRWIADRSAAGAALAGAAVFFSEWSDTHVFFFAALLAPAWAVFAHVVRRGFRWPAKSDWAGWARAAWVLLPFAALVALKAAGVKQGLEGTAIGAGRSLHEVSLFSHGLAGLVDPARAGGKIYVGAWGLALLAGALGAGAWRAVRRREAAGAGLALLVLGIAGIFLLATGTKNPLGPRAWAAWMKLMPPYGMIRQPDKIFCLLPALVLVAGALAFRAAGTDARKWPARLLVAVLLLPLLLDYPARIDPTICLLDDRQGAYAAVAEHARKEGAVPRALVIPLWPGDSHYSSLYQHYVSLYLLRMVNGYRPTARQKYIAEIFEPFQSLNSGWPDDAQLDALLARGIDHLILHEDAFPEKVSSFPADATLANLLAHPRLERLARDGAAWSFAIRKDARPGPVAAPDLPVLFPVRYWDWEQSEWPAGEVLDAADAIGGRFARVAGPQPAAAESRWIRTAGASPMEWHVRVRGTGAFELEMRTESGATAAASRPVTARDWTWARVAAPAGRLADRQTARLRVTEGTLDLDALVLTRAGWTPPRPGETWSIPAICFFRAGRTLDDFRGVAFDRERDSNAEIFYSRHLYLEPGAYRVELDFETAAAAGTELGALVMRPGPAGAADLRVPVRAGEPAVLGHVQPDNRFFRVGFEYSRNADVVIRGVRIAGLGVAGASEER